MATTVRTFAASQPTVWSVLANGESYARWVVGTSAIVHVDPHWPDPGARLRYRVGRRPLRLEGFTEVREMVPESWLRLRIEAGRIGFVSVEMRLESVSTGCRVTMVEHPSGGVLSALHTPLGDLVLRLRNVEALRRLERRVEAVERERLYSAG